MDYYVNINPSLVVKEKAQCLAAINALHTPGSGYAWVEDAPEGGFENLHQAFGAWRYVYHEDTSQVDEFVGQKWGDDETLYQAIAPYVKGWIYCVGEDHEHWRYVFEGRRTKRQIGEIIYTDG